MSEQEGTIPENTEENVEDMTELLESIHIFSLSSSQIPVQQKSIVLSDLVKLSPPNVYALFFF